MTSVMINQTNQVCIIDSQTWARVNQQGQKQSIGKDFDYLNEFFKLSPINRSSGVFTYMTIDEKLITLDTEKTYFEVGVNGEHIVDFMAPAEDIELEIDEEENTLNNNT